MPVKSSMPNSDHKTEQPGDVNWNVNCEHHATSCGIMTISQPVGKLVNKC
jgi:hypothetical protein